MANKKLITNALSLIMKNLKIKFLSFLVCFSLILSGQTEIQIASELNKLGINSMFDVNTELARRGMSEAEARKMAKVYGLDYDMYLEKYIIGDKSDLENNEPDSFESSEVAELTYNLPIIETVDAVDTLLVNDSINNYY